MNTLRDLQRLHSHQLAAARQSAIPLQLWHQPYEPESLRRAAVRRKRQVQTAGILDSYRREQGQATAERPAGVENKDTDPDSSHDEGACSAECVREVFTAEQLDGAISRADPKTLVVVDFYRTACGSCKYISAGFMKLCKGSHDEHEPVEFLKHNVYDEFEQFTELGERLRIKVVPSFYFYRDGKMVDHFATRDKQRIAEAINKHVGKDVADGQSIC